MAVLLFNRKAGRNLVNYAVIYILSFYIAPIQTAASDPRGGKSGSIVEGHSIGAIVLGESDKQVVSRMGDKYEGGAALVTMEFNWHTRGVKSKAYYIGALTRRNESGNKSFVVEIDTNDPAYKTQRGVSCGASLATIIARYKLAYVGIFNVGNGSSLFLYTSIKMGIAFEFPVTDSDDDPRCSTIVVYKPGTQASIMFEPSDEEN